MSGQSLVKLAIIVWSVAILVALFVGLPAFLTAADVQINASLIVSTLSALGSFTAAGIALWVATSGQRERQQERAAADEAQARLVIVQPASAYSPKSLLVIVQNFGTLAVVDVRLVRLEVVGRPDLDVVGRLWLTRAVLQPQRDQGLGCIFDCPPPRNNPQDPYYVALNGDFEAMQASPEGITDSDVFENAAQREPSIDRSTLLRATVWFENASGSRWETVFEAPAFPRSPSDMGIRAPRRVSLHRR
ncbi:hypothetical protein [Mycobacterium asiaticum]|nr:hypothetical protein [Mycobacterium asiaticum]